MEFYKVCGSLFNLNFSCPDEAELYATANNGKVEKHELDIDDSPICTTERNGEEITYKDYVFKINVEVGDIDEGGIVIGRGVWLIDITLNGKDINSINFTEDFKRELENHAEDYLEQLREH